MNTAILLIGIAVTASSWLIFASRKDDKVEADFDMLYTLLMAVENNPDAEIRARSLTAAIKIVARFKGESE